MDAYSELSDGYVGQACITLVRRLMTSQLRRLPAPGERPNAPVTSDLLDDATHGFWVCKLGKVTDALAQVDDQASLERYLNTLVRNHLLSQLRKEPTGKLRRKIEETLGADARFLSLDGYWHLGDGSGRYSGGDESLVRAAFTVHLQPRPWDGHRDAPFATDAEWSHLLTAALEAAGGGLDVSTLTRVFCQRFGTQWRLADADLSDERWHPPDTAHDGPEELVEHREAARSIADCLTPVELRLISTLEGSSAEQQVASGKGRSQTYVLVEQTKSKLRELMPQDESAPAVMRVLSLLSLEACGDMFAVRRQDLRVPRKEQL